MPSAEELADNLASVLSFHVFRATQRSSLRLMDEETIRALNILP